MDPTLPIALAVLVGGAYAVARTRHIGRPKSAAILVTMGVALLATEDGLLSIWLAIAPATVDPHGIADIANSHARAHMLGAGVWTLLATGIIIVLAWGPMRRGDVWAWRLIAIALVLTGGVDLIAYGLLYTHGLDVPLPGAHGGFGWPIVVAALATWATGVAVGRPRT